MRFTLIQQWRITFFLSLFWWSRKYSLYTNLFIIQTDNISFIQIEIWRRKKLLSVNWNELNRIYSKRKIDGRLSTVRTSRNKPIRSKSLKKVLPWNFYYKNINVKYLPSINQNCLLRSIMRTRVIRPYRYTHSQV